MTKEQFWEQIDITEEEKLKSEIYLKYRGIDAHDNLRCFLQSLSCKKVTYSSIATAFRYDKRIRRIIFKYIGFGEEAIRAYISNKYADDIESLHCIKQRLLSALRKEKPMFPICLRMRSGNTGAI